SPAVSGGVAEAGGAEAPGCAKPAPVAKRDAASTAVSHMSLDAARGFIRAFAFTIDPPPLGSVTIALRSARGGGFPYADQRARPRSKAPPTNPRATAATPNPKFLRAMTATPNA